MAKKMMLVNVNSRISTVLKKIISTAGTRGMKRAVTKLQRPVLFILRLVLSRRGSY